MEWWKIFLISFSVSIIISIFVNWLIQRRNRLIHLEDFCKTLHRHLEPSDYRFRVPIEVGENENENFDNHHLKYEKPITSKTDFIEIIKIYNQLAHDVDDFIYTYTMINQSCVKIHLYKPLQPTIIKRNKIIFEAVVGFEHNPTTDAKRQ